MSKLYYDLLDLGMIKCAVA